MWLIRYHHPHHPHHLLTIRTILSEFKKIEVDERIELDEVRCLAVLDKMIKQRRDSVDQFTAGGRPDLAATESAEITVLERYLPAALSTAETEALVASVIAELGASSKQDMGRVMKALQDRSAGRADGKLLSQLVAKALA